MKDDIDWKLEEEIQDIAHDIDIKYDLLLSLLIVSLKNYTTGRFSIIPLHEEIEKEGIVLYGTEKSDRPRHVSP